MADPDQDAPVNPHLLCHKKAQAIAFLKWAINRLVPEGGYPGAEAYTRELGQFLVEYRLGLHPEVAAYFEAAGVGVAAEEEEEEEGGEEGEGEEEEGGGGGGEPAPGPDGGGRGG
jgi:hypothetical protein